MDLRLMKIACIKKDTENKKGGDSVKCIKKGDKVKRVRDKEARQFVADDGWEFISKSKSGLYKEDKT